MAILTSQSDSEAVMAEINVTPFTDVLLVLLVIFMILAAMVTPPGFMRETPDRCNCSRNVIPKAEVPVVVDGRGRIFVAGRATDERRIYADLAQALAVAKAGAVSLEALPHTPYGAIVRVLDAAKADGDARVRLITQ